MTGLLLLFEASFTDLLFSFPAAAAHPTFSTFGCPHLLKATHFHSQSSEDTNDKLDLSSNATHSLKINLTNQPKHTTLDKVVTENFRDVQNIPVPKPSITVRMIQRNATANCITDVWKYII